MKEYRGLKVPEIIPEERTSSERQAKLCNLCECNFECIDCLFASGNLKTFEQWEKENNNGHN